ncbi:hypothetical protein TRAPUB_9898 [Trametes pubescens]|uniref:Uncharacterized protein n=1 Tax=Trametes pubescens TaxID=154538 RepID=A0A1M2W116_TRAPU|nr:hypothetical protein TRAPUB_9898 [Trametes pubescens]
MLNSAHRDRYTTLPSRARFRARSQDARPSLRHTKGGGVSRDDLLGKIIHSVTGEEEAIQSLLHTFGLDDEHDLATQDWLSRSERSNLKPRPSTNATIDEPWGDSLGILDKNQYLLTPVRTRLFPKASPGVLKSILRTPSLRAFTPDQSILPEDSSLLGPPLQNMIDAALAEAAECLARTKNACNSDDLLANDQSAAFPCPDSRFLLPSPPPSTELPSLESFCPPGPAAESSPASRLEFHNAKRRSPSLDSRRSSQGRRSPFLELIPSGLRAAPCRPVLTTRPAVHDKSPPLSSVPTARAARASDRRGAEHAHCGLAFGVVRDFQRVLDELQGLGHNMSTSVDDRSDAEPFPVTQAPSPSMNASTASRDLQCGAPTTRRPLDTSTAAATQTQRGLLTDRKDAPPRQPAPDSFPSGGTLLGHMSDRSLGYRRASHASSAPSSPCNGLEDEFISLLLSQAAEEETQAELLRTVADRLGNIADRKRHLARAMTTRWL